MPQGLLILLPLLVCEFCIAHGAFSAAGALLGFGGAVPNWVGSLIFVVIASAANYPHWPHRPDQRMSMPRWFRAATMLLVGWLTLISVSTQTPWLLEIVSATARWRDVPAVAATFALSVWVWLRCARVVQHEWTHEQVRNTLAIGVFVLTIAGAAHVIAGANAFALQFTVVFVLAVMLGFSLPTGVARMSHLRPILSTYLIWTLTILTSGWVLGAWLSGHARQISTGLGEGWRELVTMTVTSLTTTLERLHEAGPTQTSPGDLQIASNLTIAASRIDPMLLNALAVLVNIGIAVFVIWVMARLVRTELQFQRRDGDSLGPAPPRRSKVYPSYGGRLPFVRWLWHTSGAPAVIKGPPFLDPDGTSQGSQARKLYYRFINHLARKHIPNESSWTPNERSTVLARQIRLLDLDALTRQFNTALYARGVRPVDDRGETPESRGPDLNTLERQITRFGRTR